MIRNFTRRMTGHKMATIRVDVHIGAYELEYAVARLLHDGHTKITKKMVEDMVRDEAAYGTFQAINSDMMNEYDEFAEQATDIVEEMYGDVL